MKYTRDDLQVLNDPLEFIRQRPQMFLKKVGGVDLATAIAGGARLVTDMPVMIIQKGSWWIVAGEEDWIQKQPHVSVDDLFSRIIPFPEAGPNSMRGEILLSAFATEVVTAGSGDVRVIKGTVPGNAEVWRIIRANPAWKRVVAFQIGERPPNGPAETPPQKS